MEPVPLHIVLVEPEIHWNTGNIGRTCLAVGARLHLIEPLGFSLDARQVRRAGLDYWPRVTPLVWQDWSAFEVELPRLGAPFFFSAEAERSYLDARYPEPAVLIFGGESSGLPLALRRRYSSQLLRIPVRDAGVRSLNLSTAAAVAAYEAIRQQSALAIATDAPEP
jgi:tRNA (cytidine/uridine-2'-O-)-methyltransferase